MAFFDNKKGLRETFKGLSPEELLKTSQKIDRQNKIDAGPLGLGSGYLGNIIGGGGEMFFGGLGDTARFMNFNGVADTLDKASNYFTERLPEAKPAEFSWNYLTSPEGLARGTGRASGSLASILLPAAVTEGASLGLTGAGLAARGGALLSRIPGISAKTGKWAAGGLMTVPMESAMEAGNFEKNAIANGMSPSEAAQKSWGVFGRNAGFLGLSNALQFGMLPKIAGAGVSFGRRGLAAGAELGTQAVEEGVQQGIQNEMEGKPHTYNLVEMMSNPKYAEQAQAMKEGFLTMAPIVGAGAVGGAVTDRYRNKNSDDEKSAPNIDEFMQALAGQESGGDYNAYNGMYGAAGKFQILPENWAQWAKDAGLSPNAEMTPENQDIVAKNKMLEYYKKFGDWRKVAEAWYGGEGAVNWSEEAKARPQAGGYPSINEYADSVMARLENIVGKVNSEDDESKIEITPEMIEKAKGKYWIEQGAVSYEGAQPQTMQALYALSKWFYEKTGKPLVVSAVTNGSHADGEHSHANGWKIDIHDGGSGAEGALFTDDFYEGSLLKEFVKYGQNLGLGMNVESLGTRNVHLDVAVDGTQWIGDDAGTNYGGFKGGKVKRSKSQNISASNTSTETSNENDSVIDGIIQNLLTSDPNATPNFDATKERKIDKEIFKMFVEDKKDTSEGEDAAAFMDFLQKNKMLKADGTFKNSKDNRELLRKEFGEEIQEFGENKIAESYNRFMENKKSADEKIRSAFEKLVQQEETDGKPEATKHREILQNGQIGAMSQFLKDTGINFDAPAESQTQSQEESTANEIKNPADGWKNFTPERLQQLAQFLKSTLTNAGAIDENLSVGLDNLDEQAIGDALKMHRQIVSERPVNTILQGNEQTLSDDALKFRESYLKMQENIRRMENSRQYYEEQMQNAQANSDVKNFSYAQNRLAEIDKKLETTRSELGKLTPPQNINRVSESEKLASEFQQNNLKLNGLKAQLEDVGESKDEKSLSRKNKLNRELRETQKKIWAAQERYDEINDVGQAWREKPLSSTDDVLNLLNEGIAQTQRKLDKFKRETRKSGDNPKATKETMRLGSQLSELKSVLNAPVNPTLTISQATERIADAQNNFNGLLNQIAEVEKNLATAQTQGDKQTATELQRKSFELRSQAENENKYLNMLKSQTTQAISQHAPKVLNKIYGERKVANVDRQNESPQNIFTNAETNLDEIKFTEENQSENQTSQEIQTEPAKKLSDLELSNNELSELKAQGKNLLSEKQAAELRGDYETAADFQKRRAQVDEQIKAKQNEIQKLQDKIKTPTPQEENQSENKSTVQPAANVQPFDKDKLIQLNRELKNLQGEVMKKNAQRMTAQLNGDLRSEQETEKDLNNLYKKIRETTAQIKRIQPEKPTKTSESEKPKTNLEGNVAKVKADNGREYQVRYKVAEGENLTASHNLEGDDVFKNEKYPAELQPRDRERVSMKTNLLSMSNNLKPEELMDSQNLNQGAPIVRSDGVVLNGNGRTAAIQYAQKNGKAGNYRQALLDNAEKFGLKRDAVAKMKNPVLVREIVGEISEEDVKSINESQTGGARIGASEQAKIDAGKIKESSLQLYVDNDTGDLTTTANYNFVLSVLNDIVNKNEINSYTTKEGGISKDGYQRVKQALFALAYGDSKLIDLISESTDNNIRQITNAMNSAAPRIAQIQVRMRQENLFNYDLSAIANAVRKISELRNDPNMTVQDYLYQGTLAFEEAKNETAEKKEIVKFIDAHKTSGVYISDFLKGIADRITLQGNPKQGKIFEFEPATLMEVIKDAEKIADEKFTERSTKGKPINLFDTKTAPKTETPAEKISTPKVETETSAAKTQTPNQTPKKISTPKVETETSAAKTEPPKKQRIFTPTSEMEKRAWDIFGWKKPAEKNSEKIQTSETAEIDNRRPKLINFVDDSDESLEKELAIINEELNKMSFNPVFNPKIWKAGFKIGAIYVQRGANNFADWSSQMTEKISDKINPWLSSIWETIHNIPEGSKFDDEQETFIAEYIGGLMEESRVKDFDDVIAYFSETFGSENAENLKPMLKANYAGIKKFFDENVNNQQDAGNKKAAPFELREARELFKEKMRALKDVDIINKATGIVAQVGKAGRSKPLSDVAIGKSIQNGYSAEQHFEAAMNIKQLFEDGWLAETRGDKNQEENVLSIKYFHCETNVKGEKAVARIMAKEIAEYGHKIYTIELQELNKPTELKNRIDSDSSAGSKGSTHNYHIADSRSAEEPSAENITQTADEGNIATANNSEEKLSEELLRKSKFDGKKYDIGRKPSIIITGNPFGWQKTQHVYIDGVADENFWNTADKIAKSIKAKISATGESHNYIFVNSDAEKNLVNARAFAKAIQKIVDGSAEIVDELNEKSDEDKNFNDELFEVGNFINPISLKYYEVKKQAGVRLKKHLSAKEYAEIAEIAEEYGGWDYEHGNMFLFADKERRDAFIADVNREYLNTPEIAKLAASRSWKNLRLALNDNYGGIKIPIYRPMGVDFKEVKNLAIDAIKLGLENGIIEYSNDEIIVSNETRKELQKYFDEIFDTDFAESIEEDVPSTETDSETIDEQPSDEDTKISQEETSNKKIEENEKYRMENELSQNLADATFKIAELADKVHSDEENLDLFKRLGQKSVSRSMGKSKIKAEMNKNFQNIVVTQTAETGKVALSYSIPVDEIDESLSEDTLDELVKKYFSSAYRKKVREKIDGISEKELNENTTTAIERYADAHEKVVSRMHDNFRKYVPTETEKTEIKKEIGRLRSRESELNYALKNLDEAYAAIKDGNFEEFLSKATPKVESESVKDNSAENKKSAYTSETATKNQSEEKVPLKLPNGKTIYETYTQDKNFLNEEIGLFKIPRWQTIEEKVLKNSRDSLKTAAERKYYDYVKQKLKPAERDIKIPDSYKFKEDLRLKNPYGKFEYTARIEGDFKSDEGKQILEEIKKLAEDFGGSLKDNSSKLASFYFGENQKMMNAFKETVKLYRVPAKDNAAQIQSAENQKVAEEVKDESKNENAAKNRQIKAKVPLELPDGRRFFDMYNGNKELLNQLDPEYPRWQVIEAMYLEYDLNEVLDNLKTYADRAYFDFIRKTSREYYKALEDEENARKAEELKKLQTAFVKRLTFPQGALTVNDGAKAFDEFKKNYTNSLVEKIEKNMARTVKIDGKEMTRLKAIEGIVKGEIEETALKLNKNEIEYLQFLKENLIEPLRAIEKAGIQKETSSKRYDFLISSEFDSTMNAISHKVEIWDDGNIDSALLNNFKKLVGVLDGKFIGKSYYFRNNIRNVTIFAKAAKIFTNNAHLPYFGKTQAIKTDLENVAEQTTSNNHQGNEIKSEIILPKGYKTESGRGLQNADSNEFIIKSDGTRDFGYIDEDLVKQANSALDNFDTAFRLKAAPIRLQVGTDDLGEADGFGYKHIIAHLDDIRARGFDDILSYINHIIEKFNQIYKSSAEENRIILYCKDDSSKGLMPMDLELAKGKEDYYTIVTAYPRRRVRKEETLLLDTRPTNVSTDAVSVPRLEDSNNLNGVASQRDIAESSIPSTENITQSQPKDNSATNRQKEKKAENLRKKIYPKIKADTHPELKKWADYVIEDYLDDRFKNEGDTDVWEVAEKRIQLFLKSKFTDEELERNEERAREANENFRLNRDNNYAKQKFYEKIDLDKYPSLKKFIDIIFDPNNVLHIYRRGYLDEVDYQRPFVLMWLDRELSETELETRDMFYNWCEKHHIDVFGNNNDSEITRRLHNADMYLREFQNKTDHFEEEDYDEVDEHVSRIVKAVLFEARDYEKTVDDYYEWERKKLAQTREKRRSKWINGHKFQYDENKSVEENILAAEKIAQEYLNKFGITADINTPERITLRRKIIEELYGNGARKKEGRAFLIMGLPASGKSTIAESVAAENGALIIDSDMAKEKLPEFNGGIFTTPVHLESAEIAENVLNKCIDEGDNIVYPMVGTNKDAVQGRITKLKSAGYEINLHYVDFPTDKALERVKNRFKETGRMISPKYLEKVGNKPKENFDKLKTQENVDNYSLWDNDVERGQLPKLIESGGKRNDAEKRMGAGDTGRRTGLLGRSELSDTEAESGLDRRGSNIQLVNGERGETESARTQGERDEKISVDATEKVAGEKNSSAENKVETEINPFDEQSQVPENIQTDEYKKAYADMKSAWNAYLNGELDIDELTKQADKIVTEYQKQENHFTQEYLKGFDSLSDIQKNFNDERNSEKVQSAIEKAWKDFQQLSDRYGEARENNELSTDEKVLAKIDKEIEKIISRIQRRTYSAVKGYNELKKLLDGVIDTSTKNQQEGENLNEQGKLGESGSVDDRHLGVQSAVRTGTSENVGQERRDTSPKKNPRQQRQNEGGTSKNDTRTNAESERPVAETSTGKSSRDDSAGNGLRGDTATVHADGRRNPVKENSPAEIAGHNFHITDDSGIGEGGLKTKFKQNLDAIKLLKQLESENRMSTPSEQKILAKFNGWGTVASVFSSDKNWTKEQQQLQELLTEEEYKSARGATPNAFYTSLEIAQAIWKGLQRLGFKGGRILDPSMGSGIFFGTMPLEVAAKSELTGVELDDLTGRIAKQLYQNAAIDIIGFQDRKLPKNYYDLAISNVPFGTIRYKYGYDTFNIHNFFFAKAMDAVRPGGLVAFITGTGTMQAGQDATKLRAMLNGQADLIAAFKLPSQTFDKNAGTSVTSDILILQKRLDRYKSSEYAQDWFKIEQTLVKRRNSDYNGLADINEYFQNNPQNVIGELVNDTMYYGDTQRLAVDGKGRDVAKELSALMENLPENIYKPVEGRKPGVINIAQKYYDSKTPTYTFMLRDGKLYQQRIFEVVEVPKENWQKVKDYLRLVKAVENILNEQAKNPTDEKLPQLRQTLNDAYENFVKNNGHINSLENVKILGSDPRFGTTAAIEDYREDKKSGKVTAKKGDIFFKRTVGAMVEPSTADNIDDALALSISWRGELDIDYMSKLLGETPSQVISELGDNIFENPVTQSYELAEEYLSGNVREKLAIAEEAAKTNPKYKRNVDALRDTKVQPTDLNENQIAVNIGATWFDVSYYNQFLEHILGAGSGYEIFLNKKIGNWRINYNRVYNSTAEAKNSTTWGVEGTIEFTEIMGRLLNSRPLEITYKEEYFEDGKKKTRTLVDEEKTAAVKQKATEIQEEFEKWLWSDADRKKDLLKTYNIIFNSITERRYDGSRLTFPTLNPNIKLYPHQRDAVWRIMQGRNVLLAHCVGAGKTLTMTTSAMEMKRLGRIRKPLFAVPNNIVKQFEEDFLNAHPQAKLLVIQASDLPGVKLKDIYDDRLKTRKSGTATNDDAEDFEGREISTTVLEGEVAQNEAPEIREKRLAKRRAMLSRIATEDWDGIIISHEMLKRLPMSPETYNEFYKEQLAELENSYNVLVASGEKDATVKDIETAIANLKEKLKRDTSEDSKEIAIPFERLGIDQIYVDESDKFKNLRINTAMKRISGLQVNGSQRATEMYVKTKWLTKQRNGGGVVFASGTPISNTLGEIYTLMRFLGGNILQEKEMGYFDFWAGNFTEKKDGTELNPDGSGFRSTKFLTMTNLIANSKMLRQFADIKYADELPHLKRPKLKNGERTIIEIEPTEEFNQFKLELLRRAEAVRRSKKRQKGADNMLAITNDFRAASIDLQLVMPETDESAAGNKIPVLCDVIKKKYDETADVKGTQLVFCDLGVPKGKKKNDGNKSVYQKIKQRLIQNGIPANQIAFVHDAKNADERQTLFDKVNEGEIRVIIGSTEKMGAGTNFQKHLVALHHLDCCWKPRDIEQREGRILRNGNLNEEVEIFTYVVKDSYDGNMWEKVTNKQRMIDSVMRGDPLVNKVADSEESMTFGELQAAALGNPLMKERSEIVNKLAGLEIAFRAYRNQQLQAELIQDDLTKQIPTLERQIKIMESDIAARTDTKGDAFKIKLGDKIYTNRADAEKVLQELIENFREPSVTKIGEIGGFDIKFRLENLYKQKSGAMEVAQRQVIITLMNRGTYRVKTNSVIGIEKTLRDAPDNLLAEDTRELEGAKAKLSETKKQLEKPFAQQAEMEETRRKLEEIDAQINGGTTTTQKVEENEIIRNSFVNENDIHTSPLKKSLHEKLKNADQASFFIKLDNHYIEAAVSNKYNCVLVSHINDDTSIEIQYAIPFEELVESASVKDGLKQLVKRYFYKALDEKLGGQRAIIGIGMFEIKIGKTVEQFADEHEKLISKIFTETTDFTQGNNNSEKSAVKNSISPKRKSKGKWRTIGSASSREELQKLFNEKGMSSGIIQEDGSIKILGTDEILQDQIRVQKGRWQYGYYESDSKNLQTGDGSTNFRNIVDDKNLTEQHKLLQQYGKSMGADVLFFNNFNKDFHGAYEGNTIYLNVNSARSLAQTFAHEIFHFLKANNPKLFDEMAKAAGITKTQLSNYLAETQRTDVKSTADVTEEMIADSMQEILNRVARKNKSLVERFFAWLKDTFSKFKNFFVNPKGKLTRGQYAKMADAFGKMAVKLTDSDGNKIFRYNTRTHNLELSNGESLDGLIEDIQNDEGSEEQGFFNLGELAGAKFSRNNDDTAGTLNDEDEISQKVFEKYLTEGIMKMVRETVEKEIDEHVDFSKMSDPVARDKARDSLPSIRKMLVHYNLSEVQKNEKYKNRLATKIEYARRCFDNDRRIRNGNVRQVDRNARQGGISETRTATVSNGNPQGIRGELRGGNVGLSRNVGGEVSGARKHFLKLYEEVQNENRRSENKNQGVFNLGGAKYSRNGETGVANATEFSEQITRQNIEKGRAAIDKVIRTHEDVRSAMNRPDIGDIDFLWGYEGDPNREYKKGYGISHIIARRNLKGQEGEEVAKLMPEVIMRGEIESAKDSAKVKLFYNGYVAVLSNNINGQSVPHWLLTGFKREETESTNQRGEGFDSSAPTTRTPTPTRSTRAANSVSSENIPQSSSNGNVKFSIGSSDDSQSSNDNSSDGLFNKIKNLLTGKPNQQNERIRKKINSMLSKLAGVKIAAGHMNNGLDIVVKDVEKVIRTNRAYDWQNLLPAVGQKIAAILKLNPSAEMGNYISDWLLTGALNNTSAESKNFEKALRDNPEIRENLLEIQSTFTQWRNMTPSERIQATIEFERPKPTLGEKVKSAKNEGYQQFFEELEPVNDLVKQWEKITGEKLSDAVNPYSLLRNYRGIAGRAKLLIEGDKSAINALKQMFPQMKWDGFKTIKMILSDIGALENESIRREFSAFCEAKHVKDIFIKNREIQTAQLKIKDRIAELEKMKTQTTDAKRIKDLDKRIKQNQKKLENLKLYDTPMTESDCDAMIKDFSGKYGTAQKDLVKFSNATLTILKNSGVITEQAYFNMLRDWKNYVPMHRVFDENEDIKFGDSLKKMQGSSRDVVDPLQAIIRNTYDYIRRAEKNEAKLMLASMARTGGVGMLVEEVDGKIPDDKTTIMFYENGVKKYLQTDVAVVRAVNNMTPPSMSWFTKFLRIGTMLLRNFATVYNPSFAARNLIRDWQDAFIYSKYGFFSPMDFVRGFIHAVKQDDVYAEWMAAGGAQASFWSVDRDYTEASINNLTKRGLKKYASLNGFLDLFSRLGEWSELGTRIGYFEKAKKNIAEKNGGKIDRAALVTAALESRDLMDFARGGKASRSWNNAVAFANANLQGWDKFFRTFDPRNGKWKTKEWQRAMINLALTSVVPAVLCFMMCGDDDWYKNDLQDYEKQNYWILGENLRVPKGLDLGIRFFSNLTENFLNSAYNKDPKAFNSWWKPLSDSAPGLIPTGLEPIIECLTNYDMFRQRAIVPQYQQKLPAASQYDANTTSLAKFIGETANISPRKVDHFLFGYTGNVGRETLRIGESVFGLRDYNFRGINNIPLLGGFFRIPYQNPKVVKDFYEKLDDQTAWHNEYKATKKKPAEYNETLYNRLHKAQKEMSEISKLERKLMLDPNISGDVKQERQLALQKKRAALAERAVK